MQGLESSKAQSAVKGGGLRDCVCLVCKNSEKRQLNKAKVSSRLENLLFLMLSQHQGCDSHRELSADQQCGEQISPGVPGWVLRLRTPCALPQRNTAMEQTEHRGEKDVPQRERKSLHFREGHTFLRRDPIREKQQP